MQSLISFVLGLDLDLHIVIIILHKCRGIVDKCSLDGAARLLPRLLFVVELESYDQHNHCIDVQSSMAFLCNSLQISRVTGGSDFKSHFPNPQPKLILSRNVHLIWSVDDQERRIGET